MNFEENIESYINNDLAEADCQAFEKAMSTDAALRQSVEEQRLIINLLRQSKATAPTTTHTAEHKRLKGVIDVEGEYIVQPNYNLECFNIIIIYLFNIVNDAHFQITNNRPHHIQIKLKIFKDK